MWSVSYTHLDVYKRQQQILSKPISRSRQRTSDMVSLQRQMSQAAVSYTHLGELLVTKEDGTQAVISAGEVSVRGLYGYV